MAWLPPSRHPLHCGIRIPDFRARNDSPLRRSCHHALPAICLTRRLPAQRIRRCGLNATFRTRLQRCDGDWWPLSLRHSRVAHAAPLGTNTEICDTVRLDGFNVDPETKQVLGVAVEMTRVSLGLADDFANVIIAKRVIELAKAGERNPGRLCEGAIEKLREHLYGD